MARVFLSYTKQDSEIVQQVAKRLEILGHIILADFTALELGQPLTTILTKALESAEVLVVFISRNSSQSQYINAEIGMALGQKKLILPLLLDNTKPPSIIGNIVHTELNSSNITDVITLLNDRISKVYPTQGENENFRIIREQAPELINQAGKWLHLLEKAYSDLEQVKQKAKELIIKASGLNTVYAEDRKLVIDFLALVWLNGSFGSVGQSKMSRATFERNMELIFVVTQKLILGIARQVPVDELLLTNAIQIDGRTLRASTLRAIAILSDLEVPGIFSEWRYKHLLTFLELPQLSYPQGLSAIKYAILPLLPEAYRQNKLVVYVFPWMIFEKLVNVGPVPEEEKETPESENENVPPVDGKGQNIANEPAADTAYWMVRCDADRWNFIKSMEGQSGWYHLSAYGQQPNIDEQELFNRVKPGDLILAYTFNEPAKIEAIFKVTRGLNDLGGHGKQIEFIIERVFTNPISWQLALTKAPGLAVSMLSIDSLLNSSFNWRIISVPKQEYEGITGMRITKTFNSNVSDTTYSTEGRHAETEDQLEFKYDIESFASVISQQAVTPPLAIGLFGKWGSGKSFFMQKLKEKIKKNTSSSNPKYVRHVVHVDFNSWHYSDANLWASLITHIFEELNNHAKSVINGEAKINDLYRRLEITNKQIEENQKKLEENAAQTQILNDQKTKVEDKITETRAKLTMWSGLDISEIVFSDKLVKEKIDSVAKDLLGDKTLKNISDIEEKANEIDSFAYRIKETINLVWNNARGGWKFVWVIGFLIILAGMVVAFDPFKNAIVAVLKPYLAVVSAVAALAGSINIAPHMARVNSLHRRLLSLKNTVDAAEQKVRLKEQDEKDRLENEITVLAKKQTDLTSELNQRQTEKQRLEKELLDIGSGKLLANFLTQKSTDENYAKQLGIISWIRQDFKKLNDIFEDQKAAQKANNGNTPLELQIDRIVLYIDDLDRCNEDIVVKVLEAIHLLLAFELFVVVVGVDPRWLNNALGEKYKLLFGAPGSVKKNTNAALSGTTGNSDSGANENLVLSGAATTYDYLEKIFQIPFTLKPINKTGRNDLITYLMRKDMEVEQTASPQTVVNSTPAPVVTQEDVAAVSIIPVEKTTTPSATTGNVQPIVQQSLNTEAEVLRSLSFSKAERDYMQTMSGIFGHTPRTINRYLNIYRIIKSHASLKVNGVYDEDDYMPIMFVLSVVVGYSIFLQDFIDKLIVADESLPLVDFLTTSDLNAHMLKVIKENVDDKLLTMPLEPFQRNLDLISRFSFRTLISE